VLEDKSIAPVVLFKVNPAEEVNTPAEPVILIIGFAPDLQKVVEL
jgi:hypothetical protein